MNHGISILFRAIPLVMGFICFFYGGYIFLDGTDPLREVAGPVIFFLGAICLALYGTAAVIIRQLIHKFHPVFNYLIPAFAYTIALMTLLSGVAIFIYGGNSHFILSGHVIFGIGFVAACVATAATASVKFYLIPLNSNSADRTINKAGFSALTEKILIALTVVFALTLWSVCAILFSKSAEGDCYFIAGSVMGGLACICTSLIALVASISRQIRNNYGEKDRKRWPVFVITMGSISVIGGVCIIFIKMGNAVATTGFILIGLGLICFSILSKVLLLAKVWRQSFALANRIPIIPVITALLCLFLGAFLFQQATIDPAFFVPARVLVGLGGICFCLFSIVSILESGTSRKKTPSPTDRGIESGVTGID
ncbi:MAG: DUF2776 family protein [Odoribacter sp.]